MSRTTMPRCWIGLVVLALFFGPALGQGTARGAVTSEQVERAIREGVRFLKAQQRRDGSWPEIEEKANTGTTSLVTLALLTAGEQRDSPTIRRVARLPPQFRAAAASQHLRHLVADDGLRRGRSGPRSPPARWPTSSGWSRRRSSPAIGWSGPGPGPIPTTKFQAGDNSNTQYALLGLNAASEVGIAVNPKVWLLSRQYFERFQNRDGGWAYTPRHNPSTGSMTCAGVSSLIITGSKKYEGLEFLEGESIRDCGKGGFNPNLLHGLDWLASHFQVGQNFGHGQVWKYYYLYALERAGRLSGVRFFGQHDWYREGAEELVHDQNPLSGFWRGANQENELVATSFALLFLAKGRAPVLINKLYHPPVNDWNNDPDDVRNIVGIISRDWKSLLTWQVVDPSTATVQDLLQAPILFFNGHHVPEFGAAAQAEYPRVRRSGRVHPGRCLLRQERIRPGIPAIDEGDVPRGGLRAPPAARPSIRSGGPGTCSRPRSTRSGASSTAAGPWSSTRRRTCRATGTSPSTARPIPP